MAATITKLRIGLKPDTPEEHTRLLINVNTEEAQTALQIATDLRVRANPATAKIYYYNFDGSELLYTETIEPGGNGSWNGEPGRASTQQYEYIFNGWSTEPDQVDPTEDATAGVYSERRVYAAYKRRDISGFIRVWAEKEFILTFGHADWDGTLLVSTNGIDWTGASENVQYIAQQSYNAKFEIFLRGVGNTTVAGTRSTAKHVLEISFPALSPTRAPVFVEGDMRSLLDYSTALRNEDPPISAYAFYGFFPPSDFIKPRIELPSKTLRSYCYANMFSGCTGLTEAPALPATSLASHCYQYMFSGCTGLTEAPALPATTLASYCYQYMFNGCTGLTEAPALPATKLASYCYQYMFNGCTGLTEAPALPATSLASYCYQYMFNGCTGLTEAPALPATTLASYCYQSMFNGCTGLTEAPALPATTLDSYCYESMFNGCTGLTEAPALPATSLASYCYQSMFNGCTGLTEAPALPATTLASNCYVGMFRNCTGLTEAPALPATSLNNNVYSSMFYMCINLKNVPRLPAIRLGNGCYERMFSGCTAIKLSEDQTGEYTIEYRIPADGDGVLASGALNDMFKNTGGTFTGTPVINTTYYLAPPAST